MNKYMRALIHIPCGIIKTTITKICSPKDFYIRGICALSPLTEITLDRTGKLAIGKNFKMRDGGKIRVRQGANCVIGNNITLNSNCMIISHDE